MKHLLTFVLFLLFPAFIYPQMSGQWANFFTSKSVCSVVSEGNYIWAASSNGLLKLNKLTGQKEFFRKYYSGLPSNNVGPIAIDSQGTKWIGTDSGLVKYDGINWTVFNTDNSPLLTRQGSFFITALTTDPQGNIWLACKDGQLLRFDGQDWNLVKKFDTSNQDAYLLCLYSDKKGNIWIGTYNSGLIKYDGTGWEYFNTSNSGIPFDMVFSITSDTQGNVYAGTANGIGEYDGQKWNSYKLAEMPDCQVASIVIDSLGNRWAGLYQKGLAKYDGKTWTVYNQSNSGLPEGSVVSLLIDDSGAKWMGTQDYPSGNIVKFDDNKWSVYSNANSDLPDGTVYSISIDSLNKKWFATANGLSMYDGKTWTTYNTSNSLMPDNHVEFVATDAMNNKWVKTRSDLLKYNGRNWSLCNNITAGLTGPGNYFDQVTSITSDVSGNIWLASYFNHLLKYDRVKWRVFTTSNSGLPDNQISAMGTDRSGNLWLGITPYFSGLGELVKYDGISWTTYALPSNPKSGWISSVVCDTKGNIWLGAYNGLYKFDGQTWTVYNSSNSVLPPFPIKGIAMEKNNILWLCVEGAVVKFDGTNWAVYNSTNSGLEFSIDQFVYSAAVDRLGNKWFATTDGLSVFREDGLLTSDVNEDPILNLKDYSLRQNYPNPFNPSTNIDFVLRSTEYVTLKVYNILGKEVSTLVNEYKTAGKHSVLFNASSLPSGVYIYTIHAGQFRDSKKLMILR